MDALQGIIPDHWLAWITAFVTICAAITVILPAPQPTSRTLYRVVYNMLQWVALNLGKARNAQDVPQKTIPADGKR